MGIKPADVDQKTWDAFIAHRQKRGAKLTKRALSTLENQASLAGISTQEAMRICLDKNWISYRASYEKKRRTRVKSQPNYTEEL